MEFTDPALIHSLLAPRPLPQLPRRDPGDPLDDLEGLHLSDAEEVLYNSAVGATHAELLLAYEIRPDLSPATRRRRHAALRQTLCRLRRRLAPYNRSFGLDDEGAYRLLPLASGRLVGCVEALRWYLSGGALESAYLLKLLAVDFSGGTIKRARRELGVKVRRMTALRRGRKRSVCVLYLPLAGHNPAPCLRLEPLDLAGPAPAADAAEGRSRDVVQGEAG